MTERLAVSLPGPTRTIAGRRRRFYTEQAAGTTTVAAIEEKLKSWWRG
jgi:hypothetical protein